MKKKPFEKHDGWRDENISEQQFIFLENLGYGYYNKGVYVDNYAWKKSFSN